MSGWLDMGTKFGKGILAPHAARLVRSVIATSAGRAVPATLRAVRATHFTMPLSFSIGTVTETGNKAWESRQEVREKIEEETKKRNAAAPRKGPAAGHHTTK